MNDDCSQMHEFLFIQNFDHTETYVDHCHKRLLISYKNILCPLYIRKTHPSTSGIGAALQSRASAAILQRLAQAIPKNCQVKRLLRFLSITCHRPVGGTGHPLIHYEFDLCLCLGSSTLAGPPARIMNASKRYLYYRAHFS